MIDAVENGLDINFQDDVGQTLLNWASAFGTLDMVEVQPPPLPSPQPFSCLRGVGGSFSLWLSIAYMHPVMQDFILYAGPFP